MSLVFHYLLGVFCGILCSDDIFSHLQVSESQMVTCSFLCVRGFVDSSQDATWLFVVHLRQMLALVFPSLKYAVKVTIAIVLTSEKRQVKGGAYCKLLLASNLSIQRR